MLSSPTMKPFAKRTNWEIGANALTLAVEAYRKSGKPFFDLIQSNPTHCQFDYLKPELLKNLEDERNLAYHPNPRGMLHARETIALYYENMGLSISPEQIFVTAGTSEAYSFVFRLLANPDDTVLAPQPSYPLLDYLAGLNDVKVIRYPLSLRAPQGRSNPGFEIASSSFRTPRNDREFKNPKAVMLIHPNNPTGNYVTKSELEFIRKFCRKTNAAVISDEVFLDFCFKETPEQAPSFAGEKEILTFTLSGISKILGLPQMKISWIVVNGPGDLVQEAMSRLEIIADTYLSVSTPSQNALEAWFEWHPAIQSEILERIFENRQFLAKHFPILEAEGGWYAMLQIPGAQSDEEITLKLLQEEDVFVHPGYFYETEGNYLILSLITAPEIFQEGVSRLKKLSF
ncbi:MAG: pyridoxal phosphate-dependent aminotransferase [Candidatus Omnitrophica bacterium]|nr:pyridoxal phosphate-dependent aminotransferase [Candidatus Omnitrophota bacterium]